MRAVVTGGCGFVGRHLVEALLRRGDEVTVVDVSPAPPHPAVRYLQGDICDAALIAEAVAGAAVVYHNASVVHTRRNLAERVWAVNLGGTENVLRACRARAVERLVYVSSASAVYDGRDIEGGDESLPYATRSQAPYADSKIAAERAVLAADGAGLATLAIRPHVVFGPGDTRFLPAILARAEAGKLRYAVGRGVRYSDFTYVDNLIDALLAAGDRLRPGAPVAGQAYFVTNGEPTPFWDFVGRLLARLGLPPIRGTVPYWLAYGAATVAEAIDTMRGGRLGVEDGLSRFAVRYMCTHHYFSIEKARRDLGYQPRVSLAEGIERTAAALTAERRQAAATG
jgi:sterol-4alpha-carboxylate 3-dehydrogenase (decarboxylating)